MLDDDASWRVETLDTFPRGIGVRQIVVAQFFALQLLGSHQRSGRGVEVAVERGALVGVLAVAQVLHLDETAVGLAGEQIEFGGDVARGHLIAHLHSTQVVADGAVVLADAVEGRHTQSELGLVRHLTR